MKLPTMPAAQAKCKTGSNLLSAEIHRLLTAGSVGLLTLSSTATVMAAPQDGQVAAGQATISQASGLTTVDQSSSRAVINWGSFNVGTDETVRFNQPSANSATLNRVMSNDASTILGRISANGQVFLVNPNGILFGKSAQVNVGSLVASTANIADTDFMAGRLRFTEPGNPGATVENQGSITIADGGFTALVGPGVRNSGIINARLGRVTLAGGEAFILDLNGDQLINLVVNAAVLNQLTDASGVPLIAFVDHSGVINAEGGRVTLTVNTVKRLLDNVVNVSGVIRATGFESTAGVISLLGDTDTKVAVSGVLDASGAQAGEINVTGKEVTLTSTAMLDAGSDRGDGGNIFVGGNWQGQGALANAASVNVERGAVLDASGGASGNGGTVVVWSDDATRFEGEVIATAGSNGGQGGQVEVSGKQQLAFDGDVRAASLLLDPANLDFDTSGLTFLPTTTSGDYTVKVDAVNRQLVNGTSIEVKATNNITLKENAVLGAASGSAGLTLEAGNNIALDGSVVLNNGNFTGKAGGSFTQGSNSVVATGNGMININANGGIQATNLITTGAVSLSSSGGSVQVSQALSGLNGLRVASLSVEGRTGVTLSTGALVFGATSLVSSAGIVNTTGGTLDSGANVVMKGASGIQTAAIVTPSTTTLESTNGGVTVGGTVAGAQGLTIHSIGAVTLNGAALGAGGLIIDGSTTAGQRASSVTFSTASLFSTGAVNIQTTGNIDFAGIAGLSAGSVTLNSSAGSVSTGATAPITSTGAVNLTAGTTLNIRGTSGTNGAGGIEIINASNMLLSATGDLVATGKLKTAGATISATSINGSVSLNEVATWASGASDSGWLDVTAGRDVVLNMALGGSNTGYTTANLKYQPNIRPEMGRVTITAGRDVELNGLNLDGNTSEINTAAGLSVTAANRLVSNKLIAVNKGDILLQTINPGTTNGIMNANGIYLGNSVYSRGHDTVAGKTGYSITVGGTSAPGSLGNIFLFDNTNEFATVPDTTTTDRFATTGIAKIIIANNVANYSDQTSLLVPASFTASTMPKVTVGAANLVQTSINSIDLDSVDPNSTSSANRPLRLDQLASVDRTGGAAIGLKIQTFYVAGDESTTVNDNYVAENCHSLSDPCEFVRGVASAITDLVLPAAAAGGQVVSYQFIPASQEYARRDGYKLIGRKIEAVAAAPGTSPVTRELIYSGVIQTETATSFFDAGQNLNGDKDPFLGSKTVGGSFGTFGTSIPGFSSIGSFESQSTGTLSAATGNGIRTPSVPTLGPAPDNAIFTTLLRLSASGEVAIANATGELVFGARPGSDADLGRGSAYGGSPANVFRKRYLIAQSSDTSVCAPDDVQVVGPGGQSGNTGGGGCVRQ